MTCFSISRKRLWDKQPTFVLQMWSFMCSMMILVSSCLLMTNCSWTLYVGLAEFSSPLCLWTLQFIQHYHFTNMICSFCLFKQFLYADATSLPQISWKHRWNVNHCVGNFSVGWGWSRGVGGGRGGRYEKMNEIKVG